MILQVGHHKVLLTQAIKNEILQSECMEKKMVHKALERIYENEPNRFNEKILKFNLEGEEAKACTVEILKAYVRGNRGQLKKDSDNETVYWLHIWINGNLGTRIMKLSNSITIKIDLADIHTVSGCVENFKIQLRNGMQLECGDNITIS